MSKDYTRAVIKNNKMCKKHTTTRRSAGVWLVGCKLAKVHMSAHMGPSSFPTPNRHIRISLCVTCKCRFGIRAF